MPIPINHYAAAGATLDNCRALLFRLAGTDDQPESEVIVWRDRPSLIKPVDDERLRDLRPGDKVEVGGKVRSVVAMEVYR